MKPLYFFCRTIFTYPIRLFFPRHIVLNNPKKAHNQTIYVSNHPASFMDPLVLPILTKPVYHFLARADVFSKFTSPIFKNAHMLPIYRQQDGVNTKEKNKEEKWAGFSPEEKQLLKKHRERAIKTLKVQRSYWVQKAYRIRIM